MSELNTNYIDESSYNDMQEVLENYEALKKSNKSQNILYKFARLFAMEFTVQNLLKLQED